MPKDDHPPAFLFYVDDFSSDGIVESMTTQEVGAYVLLLCKAWRENPPGSIPSNDLVLARWTRLTPDEWTACRTGVLAAFSLGSDNRWHQKRMRKEFAKLMSSVKKRSEAASHAAAARWKKRTCDTQCGRNADAMPKDAIPSSFPSSIKTTTPKPPLEHSAGGGDLDSWENIDAAVRAKLILGACGFSRIDALIAECAATGKPPSVVVLICQEFQANRSKLNSPGAIAERLRSGVWPANGIVTAEQLGKQAAKSEATKAKQAIETLRLKLVKAGCKEARDYTDPEQIIAKAKELKLYG